jgi:hypothetical protein
MCVLLVGLGCSICRAHFVDAASINTCCCTVAQVSGRCGPCKGTCIRSNCCDVVTEAAPHSAAHSRGEAPHMCLILSSKVSGLRRGGAAAAARTSELLWQAEEVFRRLLLLAAEHPGNYIIDCCK